MKKVIILGTDLQSAPISLGGSSLGSKLNEEESFRLMDLFVLHGGNMIDTAQVYANWLPVEPSISEKTIGKWMKARKNRSNLIVTTKGAHPDLKTMHIPRMSQAEIVSDLEDSLRHLQVETIDLYWLHRDDPSRSVGEIVEILNGQVKAGKIRYFGCSNWSAERIIEAQEYAAGHQLQGFSGNQMMWSLAATDSSKIGDKSLVSMDGAMKQLHIASGLTAVPYSSQAQGLFSKLDAGTISFDDDSVRPKFRSEENRKRLERVRRLGSELSLTVTQVVLAYLLSHPFPTIPLVGCHTPGQLLESLDAGNVRFTQEQVDYLETGDL